MFVHEPGECTRTRLELVLGSLRDLDHRRVCQMVLVRSALGPQGVQLKTSVGPPEPGLIQDQDLRNQDQWEENVLQLKQQLRSLKIRDAGLVSQIQDLDQQILELRLDADWSHVPPSESPAPSRSSSGFYDFSEGPSLSNSLFSLSSTHDPETPPPSTEAPPSGVFGPQTLLSSLPSPPPSSSSLPSSSPPPLSSSSSPPPLSSSSRPQPSPSSPHPPPLCLLDSYISSLLQRRTLTSRPNQPRTTTQLLLLHRPPALSTALPNPSSALPNPGRSSGPRAGFELSQTSPDFAESAQSNRHLSPPADDGTKADMLKTRRRHKPGKTSQSLDLDQEEDAGLRYKQRKDTHHGRSVQRRRVKSETCIRSNHGERKRRQRKRRGAEEEQEDGASLTSGSVGSRRRSSVKHRAPRSQERTGSRPIREQCHGDGGGAEEGPGREGGEGERGGARRKQQPLVKIKASQTLKKRLQRLKNGTFTLLTTV